jgi:hypothetical protein
MRQIQRILLLFLVLFSCSSCDAIFRNKRVHSVTRELPDLPSVDVSNPDKFLNDLKLSPFWKVVKNRDGDYEAHARSIFPYDHFDESGRQFLFELLSGQNPELPRDYRIDNYDLEGGYDFSTFSFLSASIVFKKPTVPGTSFCREDRHVTLNIYQSFESGLGPNSFSILALRISKTHDIYLLVREQGSDKLRNATFAKLPAVVQHVAAVVALPAQYRAEEQYRKFYGVFFQFPLKQVEVKRLPGIQDRDTFYGYFKSQPDTSYEGINIRISHPVYCNGECTRDYSRLEKAEYLGRPYQDSDTLFFLIEDNAVYLTADYDKDFGTFSGKNSFSGKLEILNDLGQLLYETTDKFKGWER